MGRPRLSSFTIIGIVLLLIGIYGKLRGASFEFDPGMPAERGEAYYYIFVGILMIVNGFFWAKPIPTTSDTSEGGKGQEKAPAAPATPAGKTGE